MNGAPLMLETAPGQSSLLFQAWVLQAIAATAPIATAATGESFCQLGGL